jgi:hypothetical protein
MKIRSVVYSICCLLVLLLSSSCGPTATQNDTWKVTVYSAKHEDLSIGVSNAYGVAVYLNIEYLGPDAEVELPQILLQDSSGNNIRPISLSTTADEGLIMEHFSWLSSFRGEEKTKMNLTKGYKLDKTDKGAVSFFFETDAEGKDYTLTVGDVPPIKIIAEQKKD